MTKLTKRMRIIRDQINFSKQYDINSALFLLKKFTLVNFNESVDIAIQLNIDTHKSNHNICGTVVFPHGNGRNVRVAVFAQGINAQIAKTAGADIIGINNLVDNIKIGKFDFDIVIASPDLMHIVSKLGKFLGPRNLMPNPKLGTVTSNISEAVKNAKYGQIQYRTDKKGIIHTTIGKINFDSNKLEENLETLLLALKKDKPIPTKGIYIKKISISTTMGAGIVINKNCLSRFVI
ncbi:50S ribosomal protein L1 [secondary endosymbiont of Trabutina mannipara]|uniref:Large ribosomal subunit protein uL1 n=1 Tax=secondary endosymbiont of Trabutina mannipara TaxID=1835721 RepID=A0A1C3L4A7_9ENTR|nr:50S ribosomal protein L1 [secondary endosymbiont of Trabutina mannipara]SBT82118.1 50S ribosomal protein L1 [secondary endosymbiont of Trabutina mannipara]